MLLALCCVTPADALEVSAHSAILMDGDTGQVLYEKNAQSKSLIASTTKIMTALVVLGDGDLDVVVTVPQEAVGIEGSSMYLKAGEELTVRQLLYGMMLSSGNDAAVALALHSAGSIKEFARRMNETAAALGLHDTSFANPNGLDSEGNYSTARDLARLTQAALHTPGFTEIVSAKTCQFGEHYLVNHNKLLWQYDGALGVKTGYTKKAGRILVGAAERNGRKLISVTINAPDDWQDHKRMLDFGFAQYQLREVVRAGEQVGEIPVILPDGSWGTGTLTAGAGLSLWLLPEETVELQLRAPLFCYQAESAGEELGAAVLSRGDEVLGSVPAILQADSSGDLPRKTHHNHSRSGSQNREPLHGSIHRKGPKAMQERLQKILAASGVASRRKAEEYIRQGRVTVNGMIAELGMQADPETDEILLDGKPAARREPNVYIMLHKPRGYVTTMQDEQGRPTVAELVQVAGRRLYPVGRLDMYSEGLLLMTDDGETANRLMHPSHRVLKTYIVDVVGENIRASMRKMREPLDIDGVTVQAVDVQLIRQGGGRGQLEVVIGEGRNRQVRKMCDQCDLKVQRLVRVSEGSLQLGELPSGSWRYLTPEEIQAITRE